MLVFFFQKKFKFKKKTVKYSLISFPFCPFTDIFSVISEIYSMANNFIYKV